MSQTVRAATNVSSRQDTGVIGAIGGYEDQKPALREAGVDYVFNAYSEAGAGFSEHVCQLISKQGIRI